MTNLETGRVSDRHPPFRYAALARVSFSDTDAQGVVYYGRYLPYFDNSRLEYLRHLGLVGFWQGEREFVMRALEVEYQAPARFDDLLEVFVRTTRIGGTSVTCEAAAYRVDDDALMCTARMTLVLVDAATRRPTRIPAEYRRAIAGFEGDAVETADPVAPIADPVAPIADAVVPIADAVAPPPGLPTGVTLVVGLGNPMLRDDGIGWRVAQLLAARLASDPALAADPTLAEVEVDHLAVGGLALMERLVGYRRAVLVDAMVTGDQTPGAVRRFSIADIPAREAIHLDSAHDASLATALEAGRRLGADLPAEIAIVAIEAVSVDQFGEELTPAVEEAIPAAIAAVIAAIRGTT